MHLLLQIIWDIRKKLQKVETVDILTPAQQKYKNYMYSLLGWMKNIQDVSLVRPAAVSDLRYSPKGPITGKIYLTKGCYYRYAGRSNL